MHEVIGKQERLCIQFANNNEKVISQLRDK